MEEEKKMFEEIKPLIQDYIEYERQPMPDEWYDTRVAAQIERMQREYPEGREGYLLQALDDEEVGKTREQRKALIEELTEVRNTTKKEKQGIIYGKVQQFVDSNKEQMSQKVEEKNKKLEELRKDRNRALQGKIKAYKLRKTIFTEVGEDSKIYKVADEEAKEALEKYKAYSKEYNVTAEEIKQEQEKLEEFDKKYENIDFTSEVGIYNLLDMIGLQEEIETDRMSDGQVYENTKKVDDMEAIKKMQEKAIRTQQLEELKAHFRKIEVGYEDLLSIDYLNRKQKLLEKNDLTKVLKDIEEMTLIDVYKEQLSLLDKNDPKRKEIEELIQKVGARKIELEKQGNDGRIDHTSRKMQEDIMWRQDTAEKEAKRKQDEKKIKEILEKEEENRKKVETKVEEKIAKENEQRKKRIFFNNLEKENEALITPVYRNLKENLIENYTMEQLEKAFEGKTLEDIYNFLERKAKEQGRQGQGQQRKSQQGQEPSKKEPEKKEPEKKEPETKVYEATRIVVEPTFDSITIFIKGEKEPHVINNIKELMKDGKTLKKHRIFSKTPLYALGIKKSDPAILKALEVLGREDLRNDYINSFVEPKDTIDGIQYLFDNAGKMDKKVMKQVKKYARYAEGYGVAEVTGLKKGRIDKIKDWFYARKRLKLASEFEKTQMETEQTTYQEPKKTPRENLGMDKIEINQEKVLEKVEGELVKETPRDKVEKRVRKGIDR